MLSYSINVNKCTKCFHCVEVCPDGVLGNVRGNLEVVAPQRCVSCGHCGAVCNFDAVEPVENHDRRFIVKKISDPESLFQKKRSIRKYQDKPLPKAKIEKMIEYAEKAPCAHNFRSRQYVVVTDKEKITEMEHLIAKKYQSLLKVMNPAMRKTISLFSKEAGNELADYVVSFKYLIDETRHKRSYIFRNAPCAVFILGPKNSTMSKDDCVAAQHYMMLYGQSIGIGSCIIGYAQYAEKVLRKILHVPKEMKIFAVSTFGYPKYPYKREVTHKAPTIHWE